MLLCSSFWEDIDTLCLAPLKVRPYDVLCKRESVQSSTALVGDVHRPGEEVAFNQILNSPRLTDGWIGSVFHTPGTATWKVCRPSCVLVRGMSMSWRSAKQRFT